MITAHQGKPYPLGPAVTQSSSTHFSANIAVFSHKRLTVFVFPPRQTPQTLVQEPLITFPLTNRTGDIYHIELNHLPHDATYALHPHGVDRLVHDPYAKFLESRRSGEWMTLPGVPHDARKPFQDFRRMISSLSTFHKFNIRHPFVLSRFSDFRGDVNFSWGNVTRPRIPHEHMVIYEAHVRALTPTGTFESDVEIIPYLKWLGVTTLQLMPVFEYDELETAEGDRIRDGNMWGYSPVSWFMPMGRYSECNASLGMKKLVGELHRAGIECVLDVVYNHSGHALCPLHFFGVQHSFFIGDRVGEHFQHSNISGCGNTLSPNSPIMSDLIMESLRWFVSEYRVDGFRIDAAGVLCRDQKGKPIRGPPIIDRIVADPLLRDVKIIVEGWDAGDQMGSPNMLLGHFPGGNRISEWNPSWRDAVRRFWLSDGKGGEFREALRGFPSLFKGDRPHGACSGVNFAACHDGFCLADVVSYTKRVNSDGYDEISFNCGAEGKTTDKQVQARRAKQMRNLVLTLAVSRGIPMILQGDEMGFSKDGFSNTWNDPHRYACTLPEKPHEITDHDALVQFTRYMFKLRRSYPQLRGMDFHRDVVWLGVDGERFSRGKEKGASKGKFVAFVTGENELGRRLLLVFNGSASDVEFRLPLRKTMWKELVDTAAERWRKDSLVSKDTLSTVAISPQSSAVYVGTSKT